VDTIGIEFRYLISAVLKYVQRCIVSDLPDTGGCCMAELRLFRKLLSFPSGLPGFCALAPVIWCLAFGFTHLAVGAAVGRQSSTSGLLPFFAVLAAPVLGVVGYRSGWLVERLAGPRMPDQVVRSLKWFLPAALVAIAVLASYKASAPIHAAERAAFPRVIVNTAQLHKRMATLSGESIVPASRAYDYLQKMDVALDWGGESVRFAARADGLEVRFSPAGTSLVIPTPGIDYMLAVDAIALRSGSNARPMLALLITGRATGRRDLLAVLSESRELVYLELLERTWNMRLSSLAVAQSPAGDLLLVGSDPQQRLRYSP
jgi:hypothetical protein